MAFRHDDIEQFRVTDLDADPATGSVVLRYALDDDYRFEERFELGAPSRRLSAAEVAGFERAARLLHRIAGVSYFKAARPATVVLEAGPLGELEAAFLRDLYDKGLREFAFQNGLGFETPAFEVMGATAVGGASAPPPSGVAVPIGGGKDSVVVAEALRKRSPQLVSINPSPAARRIAAAAGLDLWAIGRTIDPALLELNAQGALNGHVPVTAIVSAAVVAAGYLAGFDTTVMALEASADEPTRMVHTPDGAAPVNHQWSKSLECEHQLAALLRQQVHPDIRYLSPLRLVGELDITRAFARLDAYLPVFRSCNRAFRLQDPLDGWCRQCPKCRFVFLALATVIDRPRLLSIFGGDLLADEDQLGGFEDLLDSERKPFECVGTRLEVASALVAVAADPAWADAEVVRKLAPRAEALDPPAEHLEPDQVLDGIRRLVDESRS